MYIYKAWNTSHFVDRHLWNTPTSDIRPGDSGASDTEAGIRETSPWNQSGSWTQSCHLTQQLFPPPSSIPESHSRGTNELLPCDLHIHTQRFWSPLHCHQHKSNSPRSLWLMTVKIHGLEPQKHTMEYAWAIEEKWCIIFCFRGKNPKNMQVKEARHARPRSFPTVLWKSNIQKREICKDTWNRDF